MLVRSISWRRRFGTGSKEGECGPSQIYKDHLDVATREDVAADIAKYLLQGKSFVLEMVTVGKVASPAYSGDVQ